MWSRDISPNIIRSPSFLLVSGGRVSNGCVRERGNERKSERARGCRKGKKGRARAQRLPMYMQVHARTGTGLLEWKEGACCCSPAGLA